MLYSHMRAGFAGPRFSLGRTRLGQAMMYVSFAEAMNILPKAHALWTKVNAFGRPENASLLASLSTLSQAAYSATQTLEGGVIPADWKETLARGEKAAIGIPADGTREADAPGSTAAVVAVGALAGLGLWLAFGR